MNTTEYGTLLSLPDDQGVRRQRRFIQLAVLGVCLVLIGVGAAYETRGALGASIGALGASVEQHPLGTNGLKGIMPKAEDLASLGLDEQCKQAVVQAQKVLVGNVRNSLDCTAYTDVDDFLSKDASDDGISKPGCISDVVYSFDSMVNNTKTRIYKAVCVPDCSTCTHVVNYLKIGINGNNKDPGSVKNIPLNMQPGGRCYASNAVPDTIEFSGLDHTDYDQDGLGSKTGTPEQPTCIFLMDEEVTYGCPGCASSDGCNNGCTWRVPDTSELISDDWYDDEWNATAFDYPNQLKVQHDGFMKRAGSNQNPYPPCFTAETASRETSCGPALYVGS